MHGDARRSQGMDARNKGTVAKEAVESQPESRVVSEDDGFFAENQASDAQSGENKRPSKRVTLRRVDPQSGAAKSDADVVQPTEGIEFDREDIEADEGTGEFDTAYLLMARKNAADRSAAAAGADGAGGSADAKSGKSAGGGLPHRAGAKQSGFTRIAAGSRDSSGDGGSEGGVLLDTWEEKQKEVE